MFKKIFSVLVAFVFAFSVVCMPVSAADSYSETVDGVVQICNVVSSYLKDQITTEEMINGTTYYLSKVPDNMKADMKSRLSELVDTISSSADYLNKHYSEFQDDLKKSIAKGFSDLIGKPVSELLGYGSGDEGLNNAWQDMGGNGSGGSRGSVMFIYHFGYRNGEYTSHKYYYGNSGMIKERNDGNFFFTMEYFRVVTKIESDISDESKSGTINLTCISAVPHYQMGEVKVGGNYYEFFGDWSFTPYDENNPPDLDLPDMPKPSIDDDSITYDDLVDFLEKLLEKFKIEFPDLSTIEGLLQAILAQCVSINGKLDDGSGGVSYGELSELLNSAILSLAMNNDKNNALLLEELIELRKSVDDIEINGEEPEEGFFDDIADSLSDLLSGLGLGVGLGAVSEIVVLCKEAGSVGVKLIKTLVDLIIFLNTAMPLETIHLMMKDIEDIIFHASNPTDFKFTVFGTEVTLLSASFFTSEIVSKWLNVIKSLMSLIILYNWLKWFRRFCVSRF